MNMHIQQMQPQDLAFCFDHARREGWNPGLHDMDTFYMTDPAGWFKAVDGEYRMIGCISAVAYDQTFGFVGFYIVTPEHRGGRVGIELGHRALDYLGSRCVGQDGVFAKVANYETWGFEFAYRNLRYEWVDGALPEGGGIAVSPCTPVMRPALLDFDAGLFPCRRDAFVQRWLALPESVVRVAHDGATLIGYGVRRRCVSGYKIGPLFARDHAAATALLRELLQGVAPHTPVYLDVPEINPAAVAMVESLGMNACFGTARMYKNGKPTLDVDRIYGVTSFELG